MYKYKTIEIGGRTSLFIINWPHACVSCGNSNFDKLDPNYLHLKTWVPTQSKGVNYTIEYLVKTKLFLCKNCRKEILSATKIPSKKIRGYADLAEKMKNDPYRQFIRLTPKGLWIAESPFKDSFIELNPAVICASGKNPLTELRSKIPKDVEIPSVSIDEIAAWPIKDIDGTEAEIDAQEDSEKVSHLRKLIEADPFVSENWLQLVQELVAVGRCDSATRVSRDSPKYVDIKTHEKILDLLKKICKKTIDYYSMSVIDEEKVNFFT